MKYYIVAGEPSGDLHGANLMRGLRKADPEAEFRFWGGDMMAEVGGAENLVKHYRETSFFGFTQVAAHLLTIMRQMRQCKDDLLRYKPDAVILIDYPGFNLKIAEFAHANSLRVFYYIAPKVWAWKAGRIKALRSFVDRLFIIFPFEREYFGSRGIEACFEGNPLMDAIAQRRRNFPSNEEFRRANGLDDRPITALLAGSRRSEIKANLRFMVEMSRMIPDRQFVVAGVSWLPREAYAKSLAGSDVRYVCDKTYELLNIAETALVTSGTATLETALLNVPEIVVYRIPWLYEKFMSYVVKIPYVSLVNLNLRREAVRELVQYKPSVEQTCNELRALMEGGSERRRMLADFAELHNIIGGEGASDRFAARMVEDLHARTQKN